jgi:hypothetical protein
LQRHQRGALVVQGLGMFGAKPQRLIMAFQRLLEPLQAGQRIAAVGPRLDMPGLGGERGIEIFKCILPTPQRGQRQAAIVEKLRVTRRQRQCNKLPRRLNASARLGLAAIAQSQAANAASLSPISPNAAARASIASP